MKSDVSRIGLGALRALVVLATVSAFALGCASEQYKTGANIDTEYDFTMVDNFAFAMVPSKPMGSNHGKILRQALKEALEVRGFKEVAKAGADLWISYDIGLVSDSIAWGKQNTLGQGRIIARGIDPASRHEVWYGWAEANLRRQPDAERRIREAVEALFENRVGAR